jgi:pimeloyl-ACP methyl ester carboxylesterase
MSQQASIAPASRTETVHVAGCAVNVMRGGKGPPVLFLHGAGGAGIWMPFMAELAESHDVIVPDHPGYGRSETPEWLDQLSDLAYFYLNFIDALGLDRVHLIGHSLGGWIAAEMAVRNTGKLSTLTLIGAAGLRVTGVPQGDLFLWTAEERARNLFVEQRFADERLKHAMAEGQADIIIKNELTTADLAWQPRFHDPQLRKWLHRIDVPTLIVWGDSDKVFPQPYGEAYRSLIKGSRLEVLPSCGHLPHIEKADAFVTMFERFAAEHAR